MNAFVTFLKKEIMELVRTKKLVILLTVFAAFGILNPLVAKLTPWIFSMMQDSIANVGMSINIVESTAYMSWEQYYKNMMMVVICFVFLFVNSFTGEYQKGTLISSLSKGIRFWQIALAKIVSMSLAWTLGYWIQFGITYAYTAYYWDQSQLTNILFAAFAAWIFGLFMIGLIVLFSLLFKSFSAVLLGTFGVYFLMTVLSVVEALGKILPARLMSGTELLLGQSAPADFVMPIVLAIVPVTVLIVLVLRLFKLHIS